jgi:hypothetical protein
MKGLVINISHTLRNGKMEDFTLGGVTAAAEEALVIGPGIPELFEAHGRPVLALERNRGSGPPTARLVPVGETGWTMFGGNFGHTSDGRFSDAVRAIYGGQFYGAVPIHDRVEQ